MSDPVLAADGHSYERRAIKKWFKVSLVSPKTGVTLSHGGTTRNFTLRAAINSFVNQQLKEEGARLASASASASGGAGAALRPGEDVDIELTRSVAKAGRRGDDDGEDEEHVIELRDDDEDD